MLNNRVKLIPLILTFISFISLPSSAEAIWAHVLVSLAENSSHPKLHIGESQETIMLDDGRIMLRAQFPDMDELQASIESTLKRDTVDSITSYVLKAENTWSYQAKSNRLPREQRQYVRIQRLYLKNGNAEAISDLMQQYKATFEKHGVRRNGNIYSAVVGDGMPFIEIIRYASSKADDIAYEEQVNKMFGQTELTRLSREFGQFIRKGDAAMEGTVLSFR